MLDTEKRKSLPLTYSLNCKYPHNYHAGPLHVSPRHPGYRDPIGRAIWNPAGQHFAITKFAGLRIPHCTVRVGCGWAKTDFVCRYSNVYALCSTDAESGTWGFTSVHTHLWRVDLMRLEISPRCSIIYLPRDQPHHSLAPLVRTSCSRPTCGLTLTSTLLFLLCSPSSYRRLSVSITLAHTLTLAPTLLFTLILALTFHSRSHCPLFTFNLTLPSIPPPPFLPRTPSLLPLHRPPNVGAWIHD